jgi:cell division protein FtsL
MSEKIKNNQEKEKLKQPKDYSKEALLALWWGTLFVGFLYSASEIIKLRAAVNFMVAEGGRYWGDANRSLIASLFPNEALSVPQMENLLTIYYLLFFVFSTAIVTSFVVYVHKKLSADNEEATADHLDTDSDGQEEIIERLVDQPEVEKVPVEQRIAVTDTKFI